ncbi:hypothetical protein AB1N83_013679 [Pleurotus pulmonarius]
MFVCFYVPSPFALLVLGRIAKYDIRKGASYPEARSSSTILPIPTTPASHPHPMYCPAIASTAVLVLDDAGLTSQYLSVCTSSSRL